MIIRSLVLDIKCASGSSFALINDGFIPEERTSMMKSVLLILLLGVVVFVSGCTQVETPENNDAGSVQDILPPVIDENTDLPEPDVDVTPEEKPDECGNALGNGNEIISGPSGPDPPGGADRDDSFLSLTVHPEDENRIFLGTERNGFLESTDGGLTWTRLRMGLRHTDVGYPEVYDISYSKTDPTILYAATVDSPGPLVGNYPSTQAGVYKSIDSGQTWMRINCGITNARVTTVYVSPLDSDRAIVSTPGDFPSFTGSDVSGQFFPGGIFLTTDGGTTWVKKDPFIPEDKNGYKYILSPESDPNILYTFGLTFNDQEKNTGFLKSVDGGETWIPFAPEYKKSHVTHFDIADGCQTIYAIIDERDSREMIKSTDGGVTWETYFLGSSGYKVTISPVDSNWVLFAKVDGLYLSKDGLKSEKKVFDIDNTISDVVFAPTNPNIVYVIQNGFIFYKSTDAGESFTKMINLRDDVLNVGL